MGTGKGQREGTDKAVRTRLRGISMSYLRKGVSWELGVRIVSLMST